MDIGLANGIRVMNLTHTGELGYVLYIPNEVSAQFYYSLLLFFASEQTCAHGLDLVS